MSNEEYPELESFQQLSGVNDAVFAIGDELVRFVAEERGWRVTTGTPGYVGFLFDDGERTMTESGVVMLMDYTFELRSQADGGPAFVGAPSVPVTVDEFRVNYFGAPPVL